MSYQITISGHVDSAKREATALNEAANLAQDLGADGVFSFAGSFFSVFASAPTDAITKARTALAEYNATADADDQVVIRAEAPAE
jgi:pyridoxal biosynthesis lyase PdxS